MADAKLSTYLRSSATAQQFARLSGMDDFANVLSAPYNAVGDGVADDTAAFTAAIASSKPILVPETTAFYKLTAGLALALNDRMEGVGLPTLKFVGALATDCIRTTGDNVILRHLIIDADKASKSGACNGVKLANNDALLEGVRAINSNAQNIDIAGDRNVVRGGRANSASGPNIRILGAGALAAIGSAGGSFNMIDGVEVSSGSGFGIFLDEGAHNNMLRGNRCTVSGLELVGMTYSCYRNQVSGNHAQGTGDNGISCTGFENVITGNTCAGNANSGIYCYGSLNSVTGNTCLNNNQSRLTTPANVFAGITVGASWGGLASYNTVVGNTCLDDQATPTQEYGVHQPAAFYPAWALSLSLTYPYISNGLNIYKRIAGATAVPASGAVAPTHTSGDVNDGTITWRFVATADTNLHGKRNSIGLNTCKGNRTSDYVDATANSHTVLHEGMLELNGGLLGTASVATPIRIQTGAVSPTGNVNGNVGDLFLRRGGSTGITAYLKEAGAVGDNTNWTPILTRKNGTTANRPTGLGVGYEGYIYFDTTLGKPIFWKGAGWVDATGTAA